MKLPYTRAMVNAALNGELDQVVYIQDPLFGFQVPTTCPEVPNKALQPRHAWQDAAVYDQQALKLASMFVDNFKQFEEHVSETIRAAAPSLD